MSDRKQALQELLAKIEAGEFDPKSPRRVSWSSQQRRQFYDTAERGGIPVGICGDAARTYRGSLDAAQSLHEAVLPEWHVEIQFHGGGWTPSAGARVSRDVALLDGHAAMDDSPARAWFCALLKALIAEADT